MAIATVREAPRWLLKACPKCGGDMYRDDGCYRCLQCSKHAWDEPPMPYAREKRRKGDR